MDTEKETKKVKNFYQKWWFWLCMFLIAIVISFTIIMMVGYNLAIGGISQVALAVQSLDNEAIVYSSAGDNTVIVEIPNYTETSKKQTKENIIDLIKTFASNNGELSNYSKFILITKTNYDDMEVEDYFYITEVYSLPDMTQDTEASKTYIDFIALSNEFSNSSDNVDNTTDSSNIENENNPTTSTNQTSQATTTNNETTTKKEDTNNKQQSTTNNNTNNTTSSQTSQTTTVTKGQTNALNQAKNYLSFMAFSYSGLIEQLKFEGYTDSEAKYGADNCGANWNEQAAKKAKSYLDIMSFSRSGLIEQLKFDGFTSSQAEYGATSAGY